MELSEEIKALTSKSNYQSKECYALAEEAGELVHKSLQSHVDKQMASVRRECDRLYRVQQVIIAAGLLDEDKFKEAYDIVAAT